MNGHVIGIGETRNE